MDREDKTFTGRVMRCIDSEFHNIDCLESETQFGFFKDNNDRRPSSCTWVDKEIAVKLFKLFRETEDYACPECTNDAGWSEERGYCCICGHRRDAVEKEGEQC